MGNLLRLIPWILECIEGIQQWWIKRKKLNEVNKIEKIVDSSDDTALADELRRLADKIENRKKTS